MVVRGLAMEKYRSHWWRSACLTMLWKTHLLRISKMSFWVILEV